MTNPIERDAVVVSSPYMERLNSPEHRAEHLPDIQLMGGVGSIALSHQDLIILPRENTMVLNAQLQLSTRREDGTKRDLDTLVLTTDQDVVDRAEAEAAAIIGDELDLSFFGLRDVSELHDIVTHPTRSTMRQWLADRYVIMGADGSVDSVTKAVFPFAAELDPAVLETWTLMLNGKAVAVPNPATTLLNYLTRSITGLRPKDEPKVHKLAASVLGKAPELREWIYDGPGRELYEFAQLLQGVREPKEGAQSLIVGDALTITPAGLATAIKLSSQMLSGHGVTFSDKEQLRYIQMARAKSKVLRTAELHPGVVTMFQKHVERRISGIVHNRAA